MAEPLGRSHPRSPGDGSHRPDDARAGPVEPGLDLGHRRRCLERRRRPGPRRLSLHQPRHRVDERRRTPLRRRGTDVLRECHRSAPGRSEPRHLWRCRSAPHEERRDDVESRVPLGRRSRHADVCARRPPRAGHARVGAGPDLQRQRRRRRPQRRRRHRLERIAATAWP